ncbi:MAG: right-handed parallel beta-helix repeat-containing protein [Acidobacteria bacterium]|nr:right-handed parallel beta-helix repeat-containing protein [Acidobacteriota bacterium]
MRQRTRCRPARGIAALVVALLPLCPAAGAAGEVQAEYYVAPPESGGSDANPGTIDAPFATLAHARDVVRGANGDMAGDIVVSLRAGTYPQEQTLSFEPADSGTNGHDVIYRAYPGERAVVSGGREIGGWTPVSGSGAWQAPFGPGPDTRQLWVDGVRAERASASVAFLGAISQQSWGYMVGNTAIQNWRNPADMEFVFTGGGGVPGAPWTESRCGISSISSGGSGKSRVVMDQPCFSTGLAKSPGPLTNPTALENAYELLSSPGQWYHDRATAQVYYRPRPGQDMSLARAVVPVLETLVRASGTADQPLSHVVFEGLEFSHATWLRPSTTDGFIELQANTFIVGTALLDPPGNIEVAYARQLRFERCTFTRLGGQGLVFGAGSIGNVVRGCVFTDTSGTPLRIGRVDAPQAAPASQVLDNLVENNLVYGAPVEYHGGPGIFAGYTAGTEIAHNEVADTPHMGISIGWGWGAASYADRQRIHHNRVHDVMRRLRDGGNVYCLGPQPDSPVPGSSIDHNWLFLDEQPFGSVYLDQGSRGWRVHENLVNDTMTNWIYLQHLAPPATYNLVDGNLHDTSTEHNGDPSNTLVDNLLVTPGAWPAHAWSIANGSGLEPAFLDLAGDGVPRNVAKGRAAWASSSEDAAHAAAAAVDGSALSSWSSAAGDAEAWVEVDLGAAHRLREVQLAVRQDADRPPARRNFEIWASNEPDMSLGHVVLGRQGAQVLPWWGVFHVDVADTTPYRYVAAMKTDGEQFSITELRVMATGGPAAGPKEASPGRAAMSASRAAGGAIDVRFTPGCGATDHAISWGRTPIAGAVDWTGRACGLGVSGAAAFDPGEPTAGEAVYFVVVAQTDAAESSYGQDSAGIERPEAQGVGPCDRPQDLSGTCP